MRRKSFMPTMVQAIAVLTLLKMLSNAQTTCNHGLGRVVYERIPDHQLQGFNDDIVKDTMPPFRMLEKCQDLCLRDRTAVNNLVRTCTSFNFQPGVRIASFSGTPEYEESICYLTQEQAHPEGIGNLVLVPNSVHFTEVCLSSLRIDRECANRRYVFERHPRKKLKLLATDHKELQASNRTDCEERCLNENAFVCRSATYNVAERSCSLTRFTRRSHPELLQDDPNSDYLENTCLSAERRCDGLAVFVKEENKRLGGPFEVDMYVNISLEECQNLCLRAEKYFCRSIEYDDRRRECIISEEDSVSQKDDLRTSSSLSRHLFDLVCLDNRGNEFSDNSVTSHLFSDGRRPDTAFQRYRNSRLGGEFHSEITSRTLSECLDECLRQASFQCRSAVYSERFRICRLSRFNQRDGHRIIYDADYDYYENLMTSEGDGNYGSPNYRPDPLGQDSNYNGPGPAPGQGLGPYYNQPNNYPSNYYPQYPNSNPNYGNYPNYPNNHGNNYPSYPNYVSHQGGNPMYQPNGYSTNMYQNYPYGSAPGPGRYGGSPVPNGDRYPSGSPYGPAGPVGPNGPIGPGQGSQYPMPGYSQYGGQNGPFPANNDIYNPNKFSTRCSEADNFRQVGVRLRVRRPFVRRYVSAPTIAVCERECADARDFVCRSFNYRSSSSGSNYSPAASQERDNCELSEKNAQELDPNNPSYFEISPDYDYYERSTSRQGQVECLDVSQQCNEDGMEFALKTPEGFFGRIYTYGFYDRCFFRGNGGTVNVLRISGAQGYPECGTQRYGDTMTNIVVVQFSDFVQTGRDKRYNLTCLFRGQGEAVVTSGYIGAGSGSPIPIEYLPAENSLSSKVRLMILYQNRPTTTIAVGDPLTFRLEAQDNYNYPSDIFATNVIARDPYSGRSVQLIDRFGCPVDNYVFPALDKSREGDGLEARFNAFKIPESNFLVFEATVLTCREGCQPAYCTGQAGRSEPSFGRRKRETETIIPDNQNGTIVGTASNKTEEILQTKAKEKSQRTPPFASTTVLISTDQVITGKPPVSRQRTSEKPTTVKSQVNLSGFPKLINMPQEEGVKGPEEEEFVREMIKVVDSRVDIESMESDEPVQGSSSSPQSLPLCVDSNEYYKLLYTFILFVCLTLVGTASAFIAWKGYFKISFKKKKVDVYDDRSQLPRKGAERPSLFPFPGSNYKTGKAELLGSIGKCQNSGANIFHSLFSKGGDDNFTLSSGGGVNGTLPDPSEPIYTDPSLFELERSRSLRSMALSSRNQSR